MPRKKRTSGGKTGIPKANGIIEGAGEVVEQKIVNTIEQNYMPYAMSVIMSRAIPEIDGFKPSHRKLLYTMYKMGLLGSARTKSANIVGQTMKLNPHGDSAIYDTMVRLSRGYEALLHPYVDSKGNFGKFYSRDMAWAASRYTEARLDDICKELFGDIEKNTVDFVDNYDNTLKEPTLLPASFPSVLVNANTGIAVGMASSICPFNLREVCDTTIKLIKNPNYSIINSLIAPDFPGGGKIIYEKSKLREIYKTGRGGIKVRSCYTYDKESHCIDITSIPPTTTSEAIIDKIIELVKAGKIKEIADIRDETGLDGLKITIDLKRGFDADKLMNKLYRLTPLEDTFSCNFNVLINYTPKVMGVKELLNEWIKFRTGCIERRTKYDLDKKKSKLHLLKGLGKILLDIDKAIEIIRNTKEESQVVNNLMIGFELDEIQAEYVAEIKLRHLNREYIIKRTNDIEQLEKDIKELQNILDNDTEIKNIIISELKNVAEKYGQPRKSMLIDIEDIEQPEEIDDTPDYPVIYFFTSEGYFKKITPQSLRMSGEHKLKEGDKIIQTQEGMNKSDILFFSDKCRVYKAKGYNFPDTKASVMGEYVAAKMQAEEGESLVYMAITSDYSGFMLFFFEDGKVAKIEMSAYYTKTNRKKLVKAYGDKSRLVGVFYCKEDKEYILKASTGKILLFDSSRISIKSVKNSLGVCVMNIRKGHKLLSVEEYSKEKLSNPKRYIPKNIPSAGFLVDTEEIQGEQLRLD